MLLLCRRTLHAPFPDDDLLNRDESRRFEPPFPRQYNPPNKASVVRKAQAKTDTRSALGPQPLLNLLPLLVPDGLQLLLARVVARRDLVEGILGALLKLLPYPLLLLVLPQPVPRPVLLHLVQPPGLVLCVRGRVPPLRVPLHLGGLVVGRERERIERVVDARRVECRSALAARGRGGVVKLGEVEAAGLLGGGLGLLGLRATREARLLGC